MTATDKTKFTKDFFIKNFRYAFVFQTKIKIKISDFYCMKINDMV